MKPVKEQLVCAGVRFLTLVNNGKDTQALTSVWYKYEGGKPVGNERLFSKQRGGWVGKVVDVETTYKDDGGIACSGFTFSKGTIEDEAKLTEWAALDAAAKVAARAKTDERKAKSHDHFTEALRPLARAYRSADPIGKQVILAKAIHHIMKGE